MISRLIDKIQKTNAPIVVGLDPKLSFIPEDMLRSCFDEKGTNPEGAAEAFFRFNKEIIDHIYDIVPAVKPQIAMYEELGIPGLITFKKTVDYAREKGLIVIGDIKRGDIGSTSESYAVGHLGEVTIGEEKFAGFDEDFATVNPYLGSDGVEPFINVCNSCDKGIFVLVKTSNPSSGEFQDRLVDGRPLYEIVGEQVEKWGRKSMATYPEMGKVLRDIMPHAFILVPGYGAQGGKGKDLVHFFDRDRLGAIVNSSRGIIAAWKSDKYSQFNNGAVGEAARAAALDMKKDIEEALA